MLIIRKFPLSYSILVRFETLLKVYKTGPAKECPMVLEETPLIGQRSSKAHKAWWPQRCCLRNLRNLTPVASKPVTIPLHFDRASFQRKSLLAGYHQGDPWMNILKMLKDVSIELTIKLYGHKTADWRILLVQV